MDASPAENGSVRSLKAPLLAEALQNLPPDRRVVIIDMGPLRSATLKRLSEWRCRIDILNLWNDAPATASSETRDPQRIVDEFEETLPAQAGEQADLVLCWTYLNYFSIEQIRSLMRPLRPRLRPGGQIHALIDSAAGDMPAIPRALIIDSEWALSWPPSEASRRPTPRHTSDGLQGCFPDFTLERTLLLANGQKELLLTRRGNAP